MRPRKGICKGRPAKIDTARARETKAQGLGVAIIVGTMGISLRVSTACWSQLMRVLVRRGRDFDDSSKLNVTMRCLWLSRNDVIIHDAAAGADTPAGQRAAEHDLSVEAYPEDWEILGGVACGAWHGTAQGDADRS
jgi:hypothetical protein